eukprot:scaffold2327_cov112-Skeletonema_dohrnii-CCMP3373.AAC.7
MLSAVSARHTECDDLHTESECKKVHGCKWKSSKGGGFCCGTPRARPDNASLTYAYVRLDADYGYEDNGAEVEKITPSARQFRCDDLHTASECENVLGCYYLYPHTHGTGSGSCRGEPWDLDHLSGHIPEEIPGLIPRGRSAGILDGEHDVKGKGDEVERTAPSKENPSAKYVYVYEEEELPNINDVYVSSGIESSPPRKGNLRAGESNRRWRLLPLDHQQHKYLSSAIIHLPIDYFCPNKSQRSSDCMHSTSTTAPRYDQLSHLLESKFLAPQLNENNHPLARHVFCLVILSSEKPTMWLSAASSQHNKLTQ